jgi:hypothetical protein
MLAQAAESRPTVSSVKVIICDTFGEPLSGSSVTLTEIGSKKKFTATGGEVKFGAIPYSIYDLEVRLPGFKLRKEQVKVYQPSLVFQVALELAPPHSFERPELSGVIKPDIRNKPGLWVRLLALYSSDLIENAIDKSGRFELVGMAPGKYLLLLFEKDTMLAVKPVRFLGGHQVVEIALEP